MQPVLQTRDKQDMSRELRQINLQIRMRNNDGSLASPNHAQSQPKIIHQQRAIDKRLRRRRSGQSGSHSRDKAGRTIRLANGDVMCGRCAVKHAPPPPQPEPKQPRLPSATPTQPTDVQQPDSAIRSQVGGIKTDRAETEDKSTSEVMLTRRVESGHLPDLAIVDPKVDELISQEDEHSKTDQVSTNSRRIRDSIEFTSMTATARQNFNFKEMSEIEQDLISEALLSELRAIARGNFELGADP